MAWSLCILECLPSIIVLVGSHRNLFASEGTAFSVATCHVQTETHGSITEFQEAGRCLLQFHYSFDWVKCTLIFIQLDLHLTWFLCFAFFWIIHTHLFCISRPVLAHNLFLKIHHVNAKMQAVVAYRKSLTPCSPTNPTRWGSETKAGELGQY